LKLEITDLPRRFQVGEHIIKDYGKIQLDDKEMVSFQTKSGKEYDFVAKDWGFYATPSINGRLNKEGFKTAIIQNRYNKIYLTVVEIEKLDLFYQYLENDNQKVMFWLDEWFGK